MDNLENAERAALKQRQQQKWEAEAGIPVSENLKGLAQEDCATQESTTYNARTHLMHRLDYEIESLIRKIQRVQELKHRVETLSVHACETALAVGEIFHA